MFKALAVLENPRVNNYIDMDPSGIIPIISNKTSLNVKVDYDLKLFCEPRVTDQLKHLDDEQTIVAGLL